MTTTEDGHEDIASPKELLSSIAKAQDMLKGLTDKVADLPLIQQQEPATSFPVKVIGTGNDFEILKDINDEDKMCKQELSKAHEKIKQLEQQLEVSENDKYKREMVMNFDLAAAKKQVEFQKDQIKSLVLKAKAYEESSEMLSKHVKTLEQKLENPKEPTPKEKRMLSDLRRAKNVLEKQSGEVSKMRRLLHSCQLSELSLKSQIEELKLQLADKDKRFKAVEAGLRSQLSVMKDKLQETNETEEFVSTLGMNKFGDRYGATDAGGKDEDESTLRDLGSSDSDCSMLNTIVSTSSTSSTYTSDSSQKSWESFEGSTD